MGGRSGQSVGVDGNISSLADATAKDAEKGYFEENGNLFSNNVNEMELNHFTSNENAKKINENGFNIGTNNLLGEGVYFTSGKLDGYETKITIKLQEHKQLYIPNDFDVYNFVGNAVGEKITNGFQIKDKMLKAGYKSMRVKQEDGSYWTVVFDTSIINIIKK